MFFWKKYFEYDVSTSIEIEAEPDAVFSILDPASPEWQYRQRLCEIVDLPRGKFKVHQPEIPEEWIVVTVPNRIKPDRIEIASRRDSYEGLFGNLVKDRSVFELTRRNGGGTTLSLKARAWFYKKHLMEQLELALYGGACESLLGKLKSFAELQPEDNEHHPDYKTRKFWEWFVENESSLQAFGPENMEPLSKISEKLNEAFSYLGIEMLQHETARPRLAFHGDGMTSAFPAVEKLVAAAPVDQIPNWEIVAFKPPKGPLDGAVIQGSREFSSEKVRYKLEKPDKNGNSNITFFFDEADSLSENECMELSFLLLDHCLGEYKTATKIGAVDFRVLSKAGADARPIDELVEAI